ncbi:uncharacterized protein LOC122672888 [Telopea speciosissima]|uniref:uncharacterized protein LOC122672888 n=1 Tax=Telopea speciosissima TaxID=54955 RepID=UPI001CC74C13|nr:uncharacterized protein LOC122672888 [Telopea speciosissima]
MEFFKKGKSVILRSHLDKYLLADDDGETVRQSRNLSSSKARWTVEFVEGKSHLLRFKSCHGLYLTASYAPFLLGMSGKRVIQSLPSSKCDSSVEWEPQMDGIQVKLRSCDSTYLRANGGPPPWRNTVTHDIPQLTTTQDWISWYVEVVDNPETDESFADYQSQASSLSSVSDELVDSEPNSPSSTALSKAKKFSFSALAKSNKFSFPKSPKSSSLIASESGNDNSHHHESFASQSGMELFRNAKAVRLRGHHEKYLLAEEDEETVCQERNGSSKRARWTVEFVEGANVIRLKSHYGKYLTATNIPFLLGMTGRKVLQTLPRRLDSSVEWEPIREGMQIRLKTRYGHFLRANGGLPPWRNSITHDIPHRTSSQDWVVWDVDIVDIKVDSPPRPSPVVTRQDSEPTPPKLSKQESIDSYVCSPPKPDGRTIYYNIADEKGDVQDAIQGPNFIFKGGNVDELTQKLEEETGLQGITVCSRNILNGKLYPLRLHLPPNNTTMHVVVVTASSKAARDFAKPANPTIT